MGVKLIAQDGEEPGLDARAGLKAMKIAQTARQGFLHEVVSLIDIARQRDREGAQVRHRPKHLVLQLRGQGHEALS
jgi:hypothetical protein